MRGLQNRLALAPGAAACDLPGFYEIERNSAADTATFFDGHTFDDRDVAGYLRGFAHSE